MRWSFLLTGLLIAAAMAAQPAAPQSGDAGAPDSRNGWYLTPHGTIRVLVIFAEMDYDVHPDRDPRADGDERWAKGRLPHWKDDLFDPFPSDHPRAQVTRYYHDMSLGDYQVLGDYVDDVITVKESNQRGPNDWSGVAWEAVNAMGTLRTAHNFSVNDFDFWQDCQKAGMPKVNKPDDPHSYDHVMVIWRNSNRLTHGQGSTDAGSAGLLFGYPSDTQSRFGAMNGLPFAILKHEFNHLLLGGNNFHSGGGNAPIFASYFIPVQGGWSLMGAANSSLMTASAWDRQRLGWLPEGHRHAISARDLLGAEVNADLDPLNGDTGIFMLRDFVTTGDALRIRMPFLPDDEYPQWLWLENHQTKANNGCPTDVFHYEEQMPCVKPAVPGIYAQMQIAKEAKSGGDIFSGHADYLRPVLANGNHDWRLRGDTTEFKCLWPAPTQPYVVEKGSANPLTGTQEQEFPLFDMDGDGMLGRKHHLVPRIGIWYGRVFDDAGNLGSTRQVFTPNGANRIAMGTNPSSANMLTLVTNNTREVNGGKKPDNRVVYLNGIGIQLLEQRADGGIVLQVKSGDTRLTEDVRWCADSIVLPPLAGHQGTALTLAPKTMLTIDRSGTPTRLKNQGTKGKGYWFSPPTAFTIDTGAVVMLERKAKLRLANNSQLHILPGARLALQPKAKLDVKAGTRIVLHGNAQLIAKKGVIKKLRKKQRLVEVP